MARIESGEHGDTGRVREWLARAVNAPRDPAWTADGVVADQWAPVSPVTGQLDAFQWRVPVAEFETANPTLVAEKTERLVALGAPRPGRAQASSTSDITDIETTVRTVPADIDGDDDLTGITEKPRTATPNARVPSRSTAS